MTETARTPRTVPPSQGLTDDALTLVPRARSLRAYLREAVDRLAGADPGLTQLRLATEAVLGISAGVGLAYVFTKLTGALQLPASAGSAAVVAATNHGLLIVGMLISAMVALMAGFTVNDATVGRQILSTLFLPVPMLAAMTIGLLLGPYRVLSLIWLVVLLAGTVYVRRFGPRGFSGGLVAFNGAFLGFFLHAEIGVGDVGWLAAYLGVGVVAAFLVRLTLFRPDLAGTLDRMRRSWNSRADRLLDLALDVLDAETPARRRSVADALTRQQVRLNECTLMIDAQLAQSVPASADEEARRLFDAELSLSNIARFAGALADRCAEPSLRRTARDCVAAVAAHDWDAVDGAAGELTSAIAEEPRVTVLAHRLAASALGYRDACRQMVSGVVEVTDGEPVLFTPAVELASGYLPGSGPISTEASTTPGLGGPLDRVVLPPYLRATIQIAVSATIAIVAGSIVSSQRMYWALLVAFLAFMATTNSGEQVRKALFRLGGTAVGIVAGDLLVHLTGARVWATLLIVLVALFFGFYLIRVNYTFMVIGITVMMSELYAQLGEFSWHLLVLRLVETAIGVGAVAVTVVLVVPLRPQRVLTTGVLLWLRSMTALVDGGVQRMLTGAEAPLRAQVRDLDATYAAFEAAAAPLRRATVGRNSAQLEEIRAVTAAARHYARTFAVGVHAVEVPADPGLDAALAQLRTSMAAIEHRVATGTHGTYTRSAALLEPAARSVVAADPRTAPVLRDLALLDGALARLASALCMNVTDHDTSSPSEPAAPAPV
jgi:uncharacterized membrane protein YgaE (UPF0421/DUF939 family)